MKLCRKVQEFEGRSECHWCIVYVGSAHVQGSENRRRKESHLHSPRGMQRHTEFNCIHVCSRNSELWLKHVSGGVFDLDDNYA